MPENNRFAHKSTITGRMHGCGHDGHTTMLLGAAQYLSRHRDFTGSVVFIFQPAEENGNAGARAMMRDGLFDKFPCDAVFGIHNMPGMPANEFGIRSGPTMASSNRFTITIKGVGGHAAQPHKTVDTIVIASEMVGVLQKRGVARKNPLDTAVLTVTQIHAGDSFNVIPAEAIIRGTVRTYTTDVLDLMEDTIRRIATTLPQVYGGSGELDFVRAYPPLVNCGKRKPSSPRRSPKRRSARKACNRAVPPFMGAEDFSFYLQEVPGCYIFLATAKASIAWRRTTAWAPARCTIPTTISMTRCCPWARTYWVKMVQTFLALGVVRRSRGRRVCAVLATIGLATSIRAVGRLAARRWRDAAPAAWIRGRLDFDPVRQ